jgi:hypothetical protein
LFGVDAWEDCDILGLLYSMAALGSAVIDSDISDLWINVTNTNHIEE